MTIYELARYIKLLTALYRRLTHSLARVPAGEGGGEGSFTDYDHQSFA